jgi:hypothetical protein
MLVTSIGVPGVIASQQRSQGRCGARLIPDDRLRSGSTSPSSLMHRGNATGPPIFRRPGAGRPVKSVQYRGPCPFVPCVIDRSDDQGMYR